jgi:diguanylate cyclase (GGDEF)-like protein
VVDRGKRFVAIIGRTFTSAENYRKATDRAIEGDWRQFPPNEFFENVLLDSSVSSIDKTKDELKKFRVEKTPDVLDLEHRPAAAKQVREPQPQKSRPAQPSVPTPEANRRSAEAAAVRSLVGRLSRMDYESASEAMLEFLRSTYGLTSLVWLERQVDQLVPAASTGAFQAKPLRIGITANNPRLVAAAQSNVPLELRERMMGDDASEGRTLHVFASKVGGDIRGAVGVEGQMNPELARSVSRLLRRVGPQLEILRLDREVSSRERINRATARFTDSFKHIDEEDFWTKVTQISAELVQSERASLLVRSEPAERLVARAAIGARIDLRSSPEVGARVARVVLDLGKPVVVHDIDQTRVKPAPHEWRYRTGSFISYPILIGDRRLAVMNFTDKVGGTAFEESDIVLLNAIMPQIAVAIDRTTLKDKAGEFEQLSVTDALTGLLNRRYLERRLNEEIDRSKRHHFPMSVMMLDVDDFKSYNDTFGHPAGDAALKIVAGILKDILRGADVAARYGGEEFAILLPQTTSVEAAAIAERLRQRIEHTEFPKRRITISIGIASCSKDIDTPDDVIAAADHALYEAKNNGRNKVRTYDGFGGSFKEKIN